MEQARQVATRGAGSTGAERCAGPVDCLPMPAERPYVPDMTEPMTAEDLLQPHVPKHAELVRGVLVVREPPGFRHGEITAAGRASWRKEGRSRASPYH